ncbi:MAG: inorganic phosphate transporter [Nitrososphaerota archaeon]
MIYILLLLTSTSFVFAANNIGMIRSSFSTIAGKPYWIYMALVIIGFISGYLLEGYKVGSNIAIRLVSLNQDAALISLFVTLSVMVAFTILRLPASISNVALGAILGPAIFFGLRISYSDVYSILLAWVIAPVTSAVLGVIIYNTYVLAISKLSFLQVARLNRMYGIGTVLFTSYSLSANNLGLLIGFSSGVTSDFAILFAAVLGSILFSSFVASTLGYRVAVLSPAAYYSALLSGSLTLWFYTQFGIPASLTQTVVASILSLSMIRKPSVVNSRIIFEILGSWPFFFVFTLLLSYAISFFFPRLF